MARQRRWWTGLELKQAREYAAEGLSIGRTAPLIGRTRGELGAAASRYGIKFSGECGAPFGNTNRLGKRADTSPAERARRHREAVAQHRKRKRDGTVKRRAPDYLRRERRYRRVRRLAKWRDSVE